MLVPIFHVSSFAFWFGGRGDGSGFVRCKFVSKIHAELFVYKVLFSFVNSCE